MWVTWVWSLGWEDPLKKGMETHSSILIWRIPMDRGAWQATVHGIAKSSDMTEWLSTLSNFFKPRFAIYQLFKNFFNWRIIALQRCIGYCCTTAQIGHNYTYIYHSLIASLPTIPPLLLVITESQAGLPVLYSSFPLAIYFIPLPLFGLA